HHSGSRATFTRNAFGVLEPESSAPRMDLQDIEMLLVPCLAVDERGYRIGYGKGLYDRFLPTVAQALCCALAFDFQLISEVPASSRDHRVHKVITDRRSIECADPSLKV